MAAGKVQITGTGKANFLVRHFSAQEGLGRLFRYELDLLTRQRQLKLADAIGAQWTVSLDLPESKTRYFCGHVTNIAYTGPLGHFASYHVSLRPALWLLSLTSNCRIFPKMRVPKIVQELTNQRGVLLDMDSLQESYPEHRYLVQYRETDLNFISRLMEHEGIYYYFTHEDGKHTMVLADAPDSHKDAGGYAKVPFCADGSHAMRDHIDQWSYGQSVRTRRHALNDYDFKKPNAEIAVRLQADASGEFDPDDFEHFDFPGAYFDADRGQRLLAVRQQEALAQVEIARGSGNVRGLAPGFTFALTDAQPSELNSSYLVTHASYECAPGAFDTFGKGEDDEFFRCDFTAIKKDVPYRPPRVTPRPIISGLQTAKVIGPKGKEICTDEQGRIHIRFHWQRPEEDAEREEASAIWVRVAQVMAGAGWGALQIPRVGHEVVVSFLEGDPDRPIVTGCVYNDANQPPFNPTAGGMVLGMKSDSTPGGGGSNELSLDDTKGKEKITLHGQFDMDTTIEHDQKLTVHNNRSATIDVDDSETVGANQTRSVGANQTNSVGANQSSTIGSCHTLTVALNSAETIGVAKELSIGAAYQVSVGAAMNETVGGLKAEEIGLAKSVNVGGNSSENIAGGKSIKCGRSCSITAGSDASFKAAQKMTLSAGDDLGIAGAARGVIELKNELVIKVGSAQITLKKSGDISIKGKKITIKGSADAIIKGNHILQN